MIEPKIITRAEREARKGKLRGLGDVVAAVTKAVGIKPCGACQKRQATLNRIFPLGVDKTDLSK